jgi:uncharacterized protein YidB (DUF937 family)
MSILDKVTDVLGIQTGEGGSGNVSILEHVTELVNNPQTGGLQGLVQQFQNNGLGDVVNSWISNGANQPISGDQVAQVVGQDRLTAIASNLGMQPDQISGLIAQHLPDVIDKLTPSGNVA